MKKKLLILPLIILLLLGGAFAVYAGTYYHADARALEALESDSTVSVREEKNGWFFDGPAEDCALIFYPGGKVEETAYAPLCRKLAENGFDVYLMKMPFNLAVFGKNRAEEVMNRFDYENWYLAGHSLGGVMAASFAAENSGRVKGVAMLAAYSINKLPAGLKVVSVIGSQDEILKRENYEKNRGNLPATAFELVIVGGNHCQFGCYGFQKGDGQALISSEEQIEVTAQLICQKFLGK